MLNIWQHELDDSAAKWCRSMRISYILLENLNEVFQEGMQRLPKAHLARIIGYYLTTRGSSIEAYLRNILLIERRILGSGIGMLYLVCMIGANLCT